MTDCATRGILMSLTAMPLTGVSGIEIERGGWRPAVLPTLERSRAGTPVGASGRLPHAHPLPRSGRPPARRVFVSFPGRRDHAARVGRDRRHAVLLLHDRREQADIEAWTMLHRTWTATHAWRSTTVSKSLPKLLGFGRGTPCGDRANGKLDNLAFLRHVIHSPGIARLDHGPRIDYREQFRSGQFASGSGFAPHDGVLGV